jgi:Tfp pilus assembly protein PilE
MAPKLQLPPLLQRPHSSQGLTLVELMVVLSCSAIILACVLTSYTFLIRGFAAVTNYTDIHQQASMTVNQFTKDMREVSSVGSFTSSYLQVTIPTNFTSKGSIMGTKTVTYLYTNSALYRTDSLIGVQKLQATNCYSLTFTIYNKTNLVITTTNALNTAKGVQLDMSLRKYVGSQSNSEEFRSARICMRNAQVP